MTIGSLFRQLVRALQIREVEIVAPHNPREGVDSMGCIIRVDGLAPHEVERIKACFGMERRTWVIQREFSGKLSRCLVVHFDFRRSIGRLTGRYLYEPDADFADWLQRTFKKEFGWFTWINIRRTEDVRGCLA